MNASVVISVEYFPDLDSDHPSRAFAEYEPRVHAFFTHTLTPGPYSTHQLPLQSLRYNRHYKSPEPVRVTGTLHKEVRRTYALGFQVYSKTQNEQQQHCFTPTGTALVPLYDIVHAFEQSGRANRIELRDIKLVQATDHNFVKGRMNLVVYIDSTRGEHTQLPSLAEFERSDTRFSPSAHRHVIQRMKHLIDESMRIYQFQYRPVNNLVPLIHCPVDTLRAGAEEYVPGSFYVIPMPPTPTRAEVFAHFARVTLDRSNIDEQEFVAKAQAQLTAHGAAHLLSDDFHVVCRVLMEMMCVFATSTYYLPDRANETHATGDSHKCVIHATEDYKRLRVVLGDDCEGLAAEIYLELREFEELKLTKEQPLLSVLQQTLRLYVPLLMLGAVTMASVSEKQLERDPDQVIAHIFAALKPRVQVKAALERAGEKEAAGAIKPQYEWEHELRVLIGEGTGAVDPCQEPYETYKAMTAEAPRRRGYDCLVAQSKLERHVGRLYPELGRSMQVKLYQQARSWDDLLAREEDLSGFYKMVVSAYTHYFFVRGLNFTDVAFVTPRTKTYGVTFEAFMSHATASPSSEWGLAVPSKWTDDDLLLIDDALEREEPLPPLELLTRDQQTDARARITQAIGRPTVPDAQLNRADVHVMFRVRVDELTRSDKGKLRRQLSELIRNSALPGAEFVATWRLRPLAYSPANPDTYVAVVDVEVYSKK